MSVRKVNKIKNELKKTYEERIADGKRIIEILELSIINDPKSKKKLSKQIDYYKKEEKIMIEEMNSL